LDFLDIRNRVYDYEIDKIIDKTADVPILSMLLEALGWQGGTIHQVIEEIKRLKALEDYQCLTETSMDCGSYNFLNDKGEDIYYLKDGKPIEHPKKEEVDEMGSKKAKVYQGKIYFANYMS
jgi:hypothetical protein